jgi:hypothetical protein
MSTLEPALPHNEPSEVWVSLVISGQTLDPNEVSGTLGLSPSETWRRGERTHSGALITHQDNGWMLSSEPHQGGPTVLGDLADALLARVLPFADRFRNLPAGTNVALQCAVYDRNRDVVIWYAPSTIRGLALIGASLDLDYYDLADVTVDPDAPPRGGEQR